jgi:hypothetical protein
MIPKIIRSGSFNMDEPAVTLLNTFSKGFDKSQFEKTAAMFDDRIKDIDIVPGKAYMHVISTGAQEYYGPNNNADGFNEGPRRHIFPDPAPGVEKTAMLRGGLLEYHDRCFLKYGGVYKNHKNSRKGGTPSGVVKFASVNPDMHRGELILELDLPAWSGEMEKLANNEAVYVSMGCSCPSDICSICGHEAFTRQQYCDHLKNNPLSLDKEGNQVYALSDVPLFHDISGVFRPADKIAFGLRKVASGVVTGAELAMLENLSTPLDITMGSLSKQAADKLSLLQKLAAIEKKILMKAEDECPLAEALKGMDGDDENVPEDVLRRLSATDTPKVMKALSNRNVMLPLGMFMKIMTGGEFEDEDLIAAAKSKLPGVFSRMLEDDELSSKLSDGSYEPGGCVEHTTAVDAERLVPHLSLDQEPLTMRITRMSVAPKVKVLIKTASSPAASNYVASEYAKYQLAYLKGKSEDFLHLTAALNEAMV